MYVDWFVVFFEGFLRLYCMRERRGEKIRGEQRGEKMRGEQRGEERGRRGEGEEMR